MAKLENEGKIKQFGNVRSDISVHLYAYLVCWKCQNSKFVRKLKKFHINVVIKLKDLSVWSMDDGCIDKWIGYNN